MAFGIATCNIFKRNVLDKKKYGYFVVPFQGIVSRNMKNKWKSIDLNWPKGMHIIKVQVLCFRPFFTT